MTDIEILQGNLNDLPEIAVLNKIIFSGMYENEPYGLDIFKARLENKDALILLAKKEDKLIGYSISFEQHDKLYLWILGVSKEYRGQGIASRFLEKNRDFAHIHDLRSLLVKTYNVSPEMLRLLIKNGYLITKVDPSDSSPKYNTIYLEKQLHTV